MGAICGTNQRSTELSLKVDCWRNCCKHMHKQRKRHTIRPIEEFLQDTAAYSYSAHQQRSVSLCLRGVSVCPGLCCKCSQTVHDHLPLPGSFVQLWNTVQSTQEKCQVNCLLQGGQLWRIHPSHMVSVTAERTAPPQLEHMKAWEFVFAANVR